MPISRLHQRIAVLASTSALAALLPVAVPSAAPAAHASVLAQAVPDPTRVRVSFSVGVRGLTQPTGVYSPRDGTSRLFVLEKTGRIRVVQRGRLLARPYLDLSGRVSTDGERGLLGLAFHPDFRHQPLLWVSYTARDGSLHVDRYSVASHTANVVSPSTARFVLRVPHASFSNHNGGHIAFGANRLLSIGTGDGGGGGDPSAAAQNVRSPLGKILRIDPMHFCSGQRYCVPPSNPFARSSTAVREIWLWGLRNPWSFSFDPVTKYWWIGDVGQGTQEEVDVVAQGYPGGNLGWSCFEGRTVFNRSRCLRGVAYLPPRVVYGRSAGSTVIGGVVYRGKAYARSLGGLYVFGDFGSGQVWVYRYRGRAVPQGRILGGVTGFGEDDAGEVWAVTIDGRLLKLRARAA
jgi:glucose/arabinose dehydrogenase